MKRRSFLRNIGLASLGPLLLNGIPVNAMSKTGQLQNLAANSTNGKVLVLIQLHGGNDGLNTLIPINQYSKYRGLRPNIAIPESGNRKYIGLDSTLGDKQQLGIHPDMQSFKSLYDSGQTSIIQNVAYDNTSGSHFRSTDVWFMGGDYDDYYNSGWMGRYLDNQYPNYPQAYPNNDMQDPLGLEIGNNVSLGFHSGNGIPTAISVESPDSFYDLVNGVGGMPPESVANSHYGKELQWIMDIEQKSNQYAGRLKEVYEKGRNSSSASYPSSNLAGQLKVISRLISGGSQTKIFLAKITGWDTHAKQTNSSDPTTGSHANLLKQLFDCVKGFQDELKDLGLADKVLTATFSEFGRRAASNGSFGTDHGAAAPLFVFGKHVNPGIIGDNANLDDLDNGNLKHTYDYRQVFGTILKDWMEADSTALDKAKFAEFAQNTLPIIKAGQGQTSSSPSTPDTSASEVPAEQAGAVVAQDAFVDERYNVEKVYPNPANTHIDVVYHLAETTSLSIILMDINGNEILKRDYNARGRGKHKDRLMLPQLNNGIYVLQWECAQNKVIKQVVVKQ